MPQSERSQIMKELLRWLSAKSKKRGATTRETVKYVMSEITSLGCSRRTASNYLKTLEGLGFIHLYKLKWKTTDRCENWLKRKEE